jgi:hypothetical protein
MSRILAQIYLDPKHDPDPDPKPTEKKDPDPKKSFQIHDTAGTRSVQTFV